MINHGHFWASDIPFTHQLWQVEDVRYSGTDPESAGQTRHLLRGRCHDRAAAIQRNEWSNGATVASFQCPLETRKTCSSITKTSVWTHPPWGEQRAAREGYNCSLEIQLSPNGAGNPKRGGSSKIGRGFLPGAFDLKHGYRRRSTRVAACSQGRSWKRTRQAGHFLLP